jgi:multidrug efflux pump subunit AcrB
VKRLSVGVLALLGCAGLLPKATSEVEITARWPGARPEEVERDLLDPIEAAVSGVEGVTRVDGLADDGRATVTVWTTADDPAALRDAIAGIRANLPADVDAPTVSRRSASRRWLVIAPERAEDLAMRWERQPGVRQVARYGVPAPRVTITVDPTRLAAYGVTAGEIIGSVASCLGTDLPMGRIDAGGSAVSVRLVGPDLPSLSGCPVGRVRLADVAVIADSREAPTAIGPNGAAAVLGVDGGDDLADPDATPLGDPAFARPADLALLHQAFPGATMVVDGDRALVWGDTPPSPGIEVFRPEQPTHEIVVTGPELERVAQAVAAVRAATSDPTWTDLPPQRPELRVEIDRDKAASLGIPARDVTDALRVFTGGLEVGRLGEVPLILAGPSGPAALHDVPLASPSGVVPLGDLVRVSEATTRSIRHEDRVRGAIVLVDGPVPDLAALPLPEGTRAVAR